MRDQLMGVGAVAGERQDNDVLRGALRQGIEAPFGPRVAAAPQSSSGSPPSVSTNKLCRARASRSAQRSSAMSGDE
jgi:hypothetical protein